MKRVIIITLLAAGLFAAACHTQKKAAYDFPPAMAANIQFEFSKLCDRGSILYNEKCAHCHNIKVKGKMLIPDFPEEKLLDYALRVSNMQHETNMPDTLVTAEDLSLITTFLTYKAKNKLKK
jgi:hypothetical protein